MILLYPTIPFSVNGSKNAEKAPAAVQPGAGGFLFEKMESHRRKNPVFGPNWKLLEAKTPGKKGRFFQQSRGSRKHLEKETEGEKQGGRGQSEGREKAEGSGENKFAENPDFTLQNGQKMIEFI